MAQVDKSKRIIATNPLDALLLLLMPGAEVR